MFKRFLWRFLPRYGMKSYYSDRNTLKEHALSIYAVNGIIDSSIYYIDGPKQKSLRLHVAPRGDCGEKGKVLCYRRTNLGGYKYMGKHRKPKYTPKGTNCYQKGWTSI